MQPLPRASGCVAELSGGGRGLASGSVFHQGRRPQQLLRVSRLRLRPVGLLPGPSLLPDLAARPSAPPAPPPPSQFPLLLAVLLFFQNPLLLSVPSRAPCVCPFSPSPQVCSACVLMVLEGNRCDLLVFPLPSFSPRSGPASCSSHLPSCQSSTAGPHCHLLLNPSACLQGPFRLCPACLFCLVSQVVRTSQFEL